MSEVLLFETLKGQVSDRIIGSLAKYHKKRVDEKRIKEKINSFFDLWANRHEAALRNEELDLGGLNEYLDAGLIDEIFECCQLNGDEYSRRYASIQNKSYVRAQANNRDQQEDLNWFLRGIRNIIVEYAKEQIDDLTRIAIQGAVVGNEQPAATTAAATAAAPAREEPVPRSSIKRHKQIIRNDPLISVLPEKMSFGALLKPHGKDNPVLYMEQTIKLHNDLAQYSGMNKLFRDYADKKIVITGIRGAGKSTGAKALFLNDNTNESVLYITVRDYMNNQGRVSEMKKYIQSIIEGSILPHNKTIIMDGLDEAFSDRSDAIAFLNGILDSNAHVWIICRSEYFSQINASIQNRPDAVAEITAWDDAVADSFIQKYAELTGDKELVNRIKEIEKTHDRSVISFIKTNPFLLTMYLFVADDEMYLPANEYELIEIFMDKCYDAEEKRGTAGISKEEYYKQLFGVANNIYSRSRKRKTPVTSLDESVLCFLTHNRENIRGFIHWDFCVYLISRQIIEAAILGGKAIIEYYPNAFLDDVTNMTWKELEAIADRDLDSIKQMNENLFNVYKQIHDPDNNILLPEEITIIRNLDDKKTLMLKDEIIYFTMRLPQIDKIPFFQYASVPERVDHPIIELGLAYGIGMTMSHPYALDFAKKLRPGNKEAVLNQSWTVAFFGDQKADDIYSFTESVWESWSNARKVRIKRLEETKEKSYRYRLFDVPLLYCFFCSRDWDCQLSEEELNIIKNCDVSWIGYSCEEKVFLQERKRELIREYQFALEYQEICSPSPAE